MQLPAACSQRSARCFHPRYATSKHWRILRPTALGSQHQDAGPGRQPSAGCPPANAPQQRTGPAPTAASHTQSATAPGNTDADKQRGKKLQYPSSNTNQSDGMQQLLNLASDQQEQAEVTSSSLRTMIQKMIDAQNLLRHWRGGAGAELVSATERATGNSNNGKTSASGSGRSSPASGSGSPSSGRRSPGSNMRTPPLSPSQESAIAAGDPSSAVQQALQPELYATKAKLSRALTALTKLQAAYQQQQATVRKLEQQLQELKSVEQADGAVAAQLTSSPASKLPGVLSALAMIAGAGAASTRLSGQQAELREQLVAAENIEQQLRSELDAKGEQLQALKQQVALELSELQGVITEQAASLSHFTQLLEESQAQLAASRAAEFVTQERLQKTEANYAAQAAELKSLSAALSAAQEATSNMRWELLTKEAALSALSKQLADAEGTNRRAAAAQADLLQQKEAIIAALMEKIELQEAAAAAEAAWTDDQLQSSKAGTLQLQEQLERLQQQQQAVTEQAEQLFQQQQATQQEQEVPPAVLAQLRGALLGSLAQQLQSLREAHVQQLSQLQASLKVNQQQVVASSPAEAGVPAEHVQSGSRSSSSSSRDASVGGGSEMQALVSQLQGLVGDNTHLAEQLAAVLGASEAQHKQQEAAIAARDQQLAEQEKQLQHAHQKLDEQTARLAAALSAAQAAAQQQQEDRQLQQQEQQSRSTNARTAPEQADKQQQQQLEWLESTVSAMLQDVQDAMLQLREEGAWAFPTSQGVVDLSIPQLVQQYQQAMQALLKDGLSNEPNPPAGATAAADAFVQAYFQVKDRDKALHTLQLQLITVKQQLNELLALEEVSTKAAQQGVAASSGSSSATVQQLEARIEKLRDNNFNLSESLTISRKQKAAAEAEAAAAKQHADLLMQQLFSVESSAAAAAEAATDQLQQELEDTKANLAEALQQLQGLATAEATAMEQVAELEGQLAAAIVHREAAAAEKRELQRLLTAENVELQHRLAAAEAAAAAGKLVLEHRVAVIEAAAEQARRAQEEQQEELWLLQEQLQQQQQQQHMGLQDAAALPIEQQAGDDDVTSDGDRSADSVSDSSSADSSCGSGDTVQEITINMGDIHINVQKQPLQAADDTAVTSLDASPLAGATAPGHDNLVNDATSAVSSDVSSSVHMRAFTAQPELQDALQLLKQVKQQLEQRDKTIAQLQHRLAEGRSARQHRKQELEQQQRGEGQDLGVQVAAERAAVGTAAALEKPATSATAEEADVELIDLIQIQPAAAAAGSAAAGTIHGTEGTTEVAAAASAAAAFAMNAAAVLEAPPLATATGTAGDVVNAVLVETAVAEVTAVTAGATAGASAAAQDMDVQAEFMAELSEAAVSTNAARQAGATAHGLDAEAVILPGDAELAAAAAETEDAPEVNAEPTARSRAAAALHVDAQGCVMPEVNEPVTAEPLTVDATVASVAAPAVPESAMPAPAPPAPAAVAQAAAAAANAGMGSSSSRAELMGSGLSMALLVPLVSQLQSAQQSEAQLLAAKSKVCQVLGLVAGTEAALVQTQSQVLTLQQRLWEVSGWRPLLIVAWQLQEAEDSLAADVAALQKLEEQQQQNKEEEDECEVSVQPTAADEAGDWQLQQQQQQDSEYNAMLADMIGWQGPAAAAAAVAKSRAKVGKLLAQLADRQTQLARLQRHVQRLAAVLMAGVDDEVLGQLQKQFEVQLEQLERSRMSVAQQLEEQLRRQQPEDASSGSD